MRKIVIVMGSIAFLLLAFGIFAMAGSQEKITTQKTKSESVKQKSNTNDLVAKGRYLVSIEGCNDCHSPKTAIMPIPVPDSSRLLSGHPSADKMPEVPSGVFSPDKWVATTIGDMTAWAGLWGTSYAFNLTPDNTTGIGAWTEDIFIKTMRTGKHMGAGRDILPPMPWYDLGMAKNSDLKAIFAYLKSLKPVSNLVPQPVFASEPDMKKP